jgi:hypothetical protein
MVGFSNGAVLYGDNLVRVVVDVPDSAKNSQWLRQVKVRWKVGLGQPELWMISHRVEVE